MPHSISVRLPFGLTRMRVVFTWAVQHPVFAGRPSHQSPAKSDRWLQNERDGMGEILATRACTNVQVLNCTFVQAEYCTNG